MMINISFLEVPLDIDVKLKDAMYLTAQPLYKNILVKFEDLHKIVSSDYRQYSPFVFNENTKKSENWCNDFQQLLILDIDDGLTIKEAKEIFKEYKYLICTTKSHQVEKKGLRCDRFRIILPSDNIPKGDEYFDFIKEVENKYPFIDKQVNTKTGAFLGFSGCEYWYNKGNSFDCSSYLDIARARKNIKKPIIQTNHNNDDLELTKVKTLLNAERVRDIIESLGYHVTPKFKFKYRENERTPSASIRHDGYIKDFGSDLATDIIGFVQQVKNMNFPDSVEYVKRFV